ncbi:MAG: hypothetical protein L0215_10260 [Gemmataceae bacterium]|nr:hypothetical protein [Gemmataceae bacterium]
MSNTNSLSPDEARGIRRRRAAALAATIVVVAAEVQSLISLGHQGPFVWIVLCVPGVLFCIALDQWWARCPRCGGSVLGKGDEEEWKLYPDDSGWIFVLPHRCRLCNVRLTAAGPDDRAAKAGRSEAGGRIAS